MPEATKRILVVDDDPQVRHLLRGTLERAGFSVVCAGDGLEALEHLRKEQIDLTLLDIGLPRMNGLEVLASLRPQAPRAKVIVVTADDTPETLLSAVREQALQYIVKPFDPKELIETVKNTLRTAAEPSTFEVLSARPHWVELLVPCQLEAVERIQVFLMQLLADLPQGVRESVGWAFRELALNAIEWGGKLDPERKVRIAYVRGSRMLMYRIADPGAGFRLDGLQHAALGNPTGHPYEHLRVREEKGLRPGGFGLVLVRAIVDEVIYNEAQNEVLFVKYLG
jgi:CheY-like chemotaxis protein